MFLLKKGLLRWHKKNITESRKGGTLPSFPVPTITNSNIFVPLAIIASMP
jgi:hypothetical protein